MKYIFRSLILLMFVSLVSCDKSLEEVNIDPNTSPTANNAQVLTGSMGYLGYIVDVDLNARSFLWSQYYTWGIGVSTGNATRFIAEPDDYNGYWQRAYANSLTDLKFLTKSENAAYSGVAKVLQAYIYQGLVDHFGSIPFTDAVKGEISEGSILTPSYDDAASVYADLETLIDEAIEELGKGADGDIGAEDLIYGGDLDKWTKFANSLKLRILMRTSETGGNADKIKTLIDGDNFITEAADIPAIPFNGGAGDQNPMFARFTWGVGDFYFASNGSLNVLNGLNDPRRPAFYRAASTGDSEGQIVGIDHGSVDYTVPFTDPATHYSQSSPQAFGETNSVLLMSDWEVWFLRAEADARYSTSDDATAAFGKAIENNFSYLGVTGAADYVATLGYDGGASMDAQLDLIGVQKWISMNGTQEDEGWIEARRFDRPASRLFTDGGIWQIPPDTFLGTEFPSTWLYPSSERSLNANAPAQRVLTDKIFWDN